MSAVGARAGLKRLAGRWVGTLSAAEVSKRSEMLIKLFKRSRASQLLSLVFLLAIEDREDSSV